MYLAKSTKRTKPPASSQSMGAAKVSWLQPVQSLGKLELTSLVVILRWLIFFPTENWTATRILVPPPARAHFEPMSFVMVLRTNSPKQHHTDWMFKKKKKKSWVVAAGAMFVWLHRSLAFSAAYMYKFIRPMPHTACSKLNKILKSYCVQTP